MFSGGRRRRRGLGHGAEGEAEVGRQVLRVQELEQRQRRRRRDERQLRDLQKPAPRRRASGSAAAEPGSWARWAACVAKGAGWRRRVGSVGSGEARLGHGHRGGVERVGEGDEGRRQLGDILGVLWTGVRARRGWRDPRSARRVGCADATKLAPGVAMPTKSTFR